MRAAEGAVEWKKRTQDILIASLEDRPAQNYDWPTNQLEILEFLKNGSCTSWEVGALPHVQNLKFLDERRILRRKCYSDSFELYTDICICHSLPGSTVVCHDPVLSIFILFIKFRPLSSILNHFHPGGLHWSVSDHNRVVLSPLKWDRERCLDRMGLGRKYLNATMLFHSTIKIQTTSQSSSFCAAIKF